MAHRRIRKVVKSHATLEGAGVRLHRAIGLGQPEEYDPFLLLDDFRSDTPSEYTAGFPWHPHRGMETITYVLRGTVEHKDSLGNSGVIAAGDLQWMSAGSGIIHQEMPKGDEQGAMYGFQLWANLPRWAWRASSSSAASGCSRAVGTGRGPATQAGEKTGVRVTVSVIWVGFRVVDRRRAGRSCLPSPQCHPRRLERLEHHLEERLHGRRRQRQRILWLMDDGVRREQIRDPREIVAVPGVQPALQLLGLDVDLCIRRLRRLHCRAASHGEDD